MRARPRLAGRERLKAILFDLDGTLTDPREGITRSLAYALERMGLEPPPLEALTFARNDVQARYREYFKWFQRELQKTRRQT